MGEFLGALFQEITLAFVFFLMCTPTAIISIVYGIRYVSYFPKFYLGRMRLARKLEQITKKHDLEFYRHREQYYYGRLEDVDCEFSLVTPKARYAVKIIGVPNRYMNLYLTDHDVYYTQRPSFLFNRFGDGKEPVLHEIAPHRFYVSDERVSDDITPVYLINPCPRILYYTRAHSHEKKQPYDGENLDGITLYTLTGFLKKIEEDCRPEEPEEE
ncbi:MAG: hypothetical protein II328_04520 [Clostridia bacterium]|nr:hypothetical protein [Clostridia bacterium]